MPSAPASWAACACSIASSVPSADTPEITSTSPETSLAITAVTRRRSAGDSEVISPVWPLQTSPRISSKPASQRT